MIKICEKVKYRANSNLLEVKATVDMFRNIALKKLATAAATSVAFSFAFAVDILKADAASFKSISQIYAFGDSYSDNGASFQISQKAVEAGVPGASILPANPALGIYDIGGRWTNGATSVEVLAQLDHLKLTDYAVGGAESSHGNFNHWLDSYQDTGFFGQIEQYKAEFPGQAVDPNALYFIFVSGNDFLEVSNSPIATIEQRATQTASNIVEGVSQLAALGAKQFFVVNSSDLAVLPYYQDEVDKAATFRDVVNGLLPDEINSLSQQLGLEIALYDHVAISNQIRSNPAKYGLTDLKDACQPIYPQVKPVCSTPDQYYFWDEIHPTRHVHQIIGEDMARFLSSQESRAVPEPSSVLALLVTLGMLSVLKRKLL